MAPREDGIEGTKPLGIQTGEFAWAQTPWVYPRKRFEQWASIAPREDGTEAPYIFWRNGGWEIQPWQPPHPRREKFGTLVFGHAGIYYPFIPPTVAIFWQFDPPFTPLRNVNLQAVLETGDRGHQD